MVASAIDELIEEYRNDGAVLWTDEVARQFRREHPRCGAGAEQIAEMMAAEAMHVGVPILLPLKHL